jgi:hypothetical protein
MSDTDYKEKLKSLGWGIQRGRSVTERVVDERNGSTAGVITKHWDGSQDAAARPKPIRVRARLLNEEDR